MDARRVSITVDQGRGNDLSAKHRKEGHETLVRVRVGPGDVEGRAEFGTLALRGPERCDEVEVLVRRRPYLDRRVGRPGGGALGKEEDERGVFRQETEPTKTGVDVSRNRPRDPKRRPQSPLEIVV